MIISRIFYFNFHFNVTDFCFGCPSFQPSNSYECWIWWKNYHMGCEFLAMTSCYTLIYCCFACANNALLMVFIDMGGHTCTNIWNRTVQVGWWEVFTVSYRVKIAILSVMYCCLEQLSILLITRVIFSVIPLY